MKKLITILLCLTLLVSITLVACKAETKTDDKADTKTEDAPAEKMDEAEEVTVTMSMGGTADAEKIANLESYFIPFNEEYPNINVEMVFIASEGGSYWNGLMVKLQTMIAAGNAPDTILMAIEGIAAMIDQGLAYDIAPYLSENPELIGDSAEDIHPKLQVPFMRGDKNYG